MCRTRNDSFFYFVKIEALDNPFRYDLNNSILALVLVVVFTRQIMVRLFSVAVDDK